MIRHFRTTAIIAGLLVSAPAFAADLVVDAAAPPAADASSRAYATFFAGASLPHANISLTDPDGPDVGLHAGLDFDTGYIIGGAIGTEVLPSLRGEIEFSVIKSSVSEFIMDDEAVDTTGYNALANLWYDVDTGTSFTPYIGGGVGYGYDVISGALPGEDLNTSGWLYQLGVGVRFAATDNIGLDLGYRYRVQPNAEVTGDLLDLPDAPEVRSSATNHIVTAGVTIGF